MKHQRYHARFFVLLLALLMMFTTACGTAPAEETPVELCLVWHGTVLAPGSGFGDVTAEPDDDLLVYVNGEKVTDFTVCSAEPEIMRVERAGPGRIRLTKLRSFEDRMIEFTVSYGGKDYAFRCNDDGLASLSLNWHGNEITPGMCFGNVTAVPDDNLLVEVDGVQLTDFTVSSTEPEVMRVERAEDGRICLTKLQSFGGRMIEFTVTYGGQDYSFRCNDDGLPMEAQPPQKTPEEELVAYLTTPQYTKEQIDQWVAEGLAIEQWAEKIRVPADVVQLLNAINYREKEYNDNVTFHDYVLDVEWGSAWNGQTVFHYRSGNCTGTSNIVNTLLSGDFDEQGYVESNGANGGHIFNYIVSDGIYVFCDFVGIPGSAGFGNERIYDADTREYLSCVASSPQAFADWYLNDGYFSHEFNDANIEGYLYHLFMYPQEGTKIPKGFDAKSEQTKFGNCVWDVLPEQYRERYTILFEREGYPIRFVPILDANTWPEEIR